MAAILTACSVNTSEDSSKSAQEYAQEKQEEILKCFEDGDKQYNAYTQKIVTESGKEYKISFDGWYKCKDNSDKEGVMLIKVIDTLVKVDPAKEDNDNGIYNIGIKEK